MNQQEHGVREVEAELLARWSGRRRAGVAGRANSGEERRAVAELAARAGATAAVRAMEKRREGGNGGVRLCGGINPYTLTAKIGPAWISGFGPPKDDAQPGQPVRSLTQGVKTDLMIKQDLGRLE